MRKYIMIAISMFIVSFFVGFIILNNSNLGLEGVLYGPVDSPNFFELLYVNGSVCLFLIIGAGIVSVPLGCYQGLQLGAMLALWISNDYNVMHFFLLTVPHCIFELPALIISIALGLRVFDVLVCYYKHEKIDIRNFVCQLKKWMISVLVLLIVAGLIESFVTGNLFNKIVF